MHRGTSPRLLVNFFQRQLTPLIENTLAKRFRYRVERPTVKYDAIPILSLQKGVRRVTQVRLRQDFTPFLVMTPTYRTSGSLPTALYYVVSIPIIPTTQLGNSIMGTGLYNKRKYRVTFSTRVLYGAIIKYASKRRRFALILYLNVLYDILYPSFLNRTRDHPHLKPACVGHHVNRSLYGFDPNGAIIFHYHRIVPGQKIHRSLHRRYCRHRGTTIPRKRFVLSTPRLPR